MTHIEELTRVIQGCINMDFSARGIAETIDNKRDIPLERIVIALQQVMTNKGLGPINYNLDVIAQTLKKELNI